MQLLSQLMQLLQEIFFRTFQGAKKNGRCQTGNALVYSSDLVPLLTGINGVLVDFTLNNVVKYGRGSTCMEAVKDALLIIRWRFAYGRQNRYELWSCYNKCSKKAILFLIFIHLGFLQQFLPVCEEFGTTFCAPEEY